MNPLVNDMNFGLITLLTIAAIAVLISCVRCRGWGYLLAFLTLALLTNVGGILPLLLIQLGKWAPEDYRGFMNIAGPWLTAARLVAWSFLLTFVVRLRFVPPDATPVDGSNAGEAMTIRRALFAFRGRLSRGDYWDKGFLSMLPVGLVTIILAYGMNQDWAHQVSALVGLLSLWPGLALIVKRLHDRDKSGWYALIMLIPLVGPLIVYAEVWFIKGTDGPNRFGPDTGPSPAAPVLAPRASSI